MHQMQAIVERAAHIGLFFLAAIHPRFVDASEELLDHFRSAPLPTNEAEYFEAVDGFSPHVIAALREAGSRFELRRLLRKAEPQCEGSWKDCWYLYEIGRHLFAAQVSSESEVCSGDGLR